MTISAHISKSQIIGWAVTALLTVACLLIPEQGFYVYSVKVFVSCTVFCLSLAAFELLPNMLIAIIMPSLYVGFGCATSSVVMSPWVGTTVLMMAGAFFMATTLEASGLLRRIAYHLMCLAKGNYFALLTTIMVSAVILNILTSGRGYLVMAPLCLGLCVSLGGMKNRLGAGIAAAVMLGGCTSHAYTYQATAWAVVWRMAEGYVAPGDVTPFSIILHNWPMFLVSMLMIFIISKWYKPEQEIGNIGYFKEQLGKMGDLTRREKSNGIMLIMILVYIFTVQYHKLDINLGFAIIPWIVYLPFMNGADWDTIKLASWDMVFFAMACMSIGTVATSLGIGTVLADLCLTVLNGSTSIFAILSLVFGIVFGLNFLMTPMAIFALITQPVLEIATSMGYSPIPFVYAINACSEAIILPYEYIPYLIVYSFGMISMKDFLKINIMRSAIFFAGFLLVLVPYWMLIGLV